VFELDSRAGMGIERSQERQMTMTGKSLTGLVLTAALAGTGFVAMAGDDYGTCRGIKECFADQACDDFLVPEMRKALVEYYIENCVGPGNES
jgi:hypothetical protein